MKKFIEITDNKISRYNLLKRGAICFILFISVFQPLFSQNSFLTHDFIQLEKKTALAQTSFKGVPESNNYNLYYHRLEWEVNPEILYISGKITSYFTPVVANFDKIYFDLSDSLIVDSVLYHGINVSFSQTIGDVLEISLPLQIPEGVTDSITVYYQGEPDQTNDSRAFIQSSHANDSIIWTLSEPNGAKYWWPCKQNLNDKIDSIDVIVTTPKKYKVASQGVLINQIVDGNNITYHWKHRYPITTYLISLSITNYAEFTNNVVLSEGTLPVLNYVYPEDSSSAYNQSLLIAPIFEMFDTLFGPYPFMNEKYGHAQFGWGGGMEHQTMSSMYNFTRPLMAHELAHQWFGNKVTCGSWKEVWLNEGFATYSTGLTFRYLIDDWWLAWREGVVGDIVALPDGSVYNIDTTDINRIFDSRLSYSKGSYLLRMLEWKLGADIFFQGVRNYLTDVDLSYNYATTPNLIFHLEQVSGVDLTEYFDDWFYGEGYPTYQIHWGQIGSSMSFDIFQTTSHSSVDFYEMPIPIYLKGAGVDTTVVFDHSFSGETFLAEIPFTVDSVFFDPEIWLISGLDNEVVSIFEIDRNNRLKFFPNPVKKILSIESNSIILQYRIYNVLGKVVKAFNFNQPELQVRINMSTLNQGTYFVEVFTDDSIIRKKINKID